MTIIKPMHFKCAICKESNEFHVPMSATSVGSPDLDTRPSEMARSLIYNLIQRCNSCGYCAFDISNCKNNTKIIVKSDQYQDILNDKSLPTVAASYMALSYENIQHNKFSEAAWNLIHSAWICDDESKHELAKVFRKKSLECIAKAKAKNQKISDQDEACELIKIDLCRRSGLYSEAITICESINQKTADEMLLKIIKFQISLIHNRDTSAHTVSEAMN